MDLEDNFYITLINGENIVQSKDCHFGIIDNIGRFVGTTRSLQQLLGKDCIAICICSKAGVEESIERIIPKSSILSFDKNSQTLTRKVIIEKHKIVKT